MLRGKFFSNKGIFYVEKVFWSCYYIDGAIVIGNKGARIKAISTAARESIEDLLGSKVFLRMEVAVDKEWTKHESSLRKYGIVEESEG